MRFIPITGAALGALLFVTPHERSPTEEQIRRLHVEEVDAFLKHDVATLERIWSDDMVVTNPFNKFVTKRQVLAMVSSGTLAFRGYERQVEYVHDYGAFVVAAGSEDVQWGGKLPLAGQSSHLRFTTVWTQQGGQWREVARHANIVPPK
jgi:ketosteroid isomerase-like protein